MSAALFPDAPADLLRQLEAKLQSLMQQRNQLREELDRVRKDAGSHTDTLRQLQERVAELTRERDALAAERQDTLAQVEAILQMMESLA